MTAKIAGADGIYLPAVLQVDVVAPDGRTMKVQAEGEVSKSGNVWYHWEATGVKFNFDPLHDDLRYIYEGNILAKGTPTVTRPRKNKLGVEIAGTGDKPTLSSSLSIVLGGEKRNQQGHVTELVERHYTLIGSVFQQKMDEGVPVWRLGLRTLAQARRAPTKVGNFTGDSIFA